MAIGLTFATLQYGHLVGLDFAVAVREGQTHHRVLKTLAGMDGDDLDQVVVTLQAHGLFFGVAHPPRLDLFDLPSQPSDQRLLATVFAAGGLQQFGQMQHIGQAALTVAAGAPATGQLQHMQRLAQHGQHALPLPDQAQLAHLPGPLVQQLVLRGQRVQL